MTHKKKLIEVALPLEAINKAAAREKSIRHGHPSTLHLWWARRPLAAARAVIFSQMVDDPSSYPDLFPTEKAQEKERQRLFKIIEDLVLWENTTNEEVLQRAREEIWQSWRRACVENVDHPRAKELFDRHKLPAFHDPFAGGGALPLEAQRLGLEAYASDLNPVAVLINKAMIEIPPKFAGRPPVNPEAQRKMKESLFGVHATKNECHTEPSKCHTELVSGSHSTDNGEIPKQVRNDNFGQWKGAQGLAEDVRYYGKWMRDEAEKRIGHLYPKIEIPPLPPPLAKGGYGGVFAERPDLIPYAGKKLTVIAWLWARTVKSPNPAFANVDVPLVSTFMLSTKPGKEAYVEPVIENGGYRFTVKVGKPKDAVGAKHGTKLARGANFKCIMSNMPIEDKYIKSESMAGRMGARLMAIVAEGERGRVYLSPITEHEAVARKAEPAWKPDQEMNRDTRDLVSGRGYGFFTWADLFTPRQLVALTTFSDLVAEAMERVKEDALDCHPELVSGSTSAKNEIPKQVRNDSDNNASLRDGGTGAAAYADAVGVYLGLGVSRLADICNSLCSWETSKTQVRHLFTKQAIPMLWDYGENNLFAEAAGDYKISLGNLLRVLERMPASGISAVVQHDAQGQNMSNGKVVSTDPMSFT